MIRFLRDLFHAQLCDRWLWCEPDWIEAAMFGFPRPRCSRCHRVIP